MNNSKSGVECAPMNSSNERGLPVGSEKAAVIEEKPRASKSPPFGDKLDDSYNEFTPNATKAKPAKKSGSRTANIKVRRPVAAARSSKKSAFSDKVDDSVNGFDPPARGK